MNRTAERTVGVCRLGGFRRRDVRVLSIHEKRANGGGNVRREGRQGRKEGVGNIACVRDRKTQLIRRVGEKKQKGMIEVEKKKEQMDGMRVKKGKN